MASRSAACLFLMLSLSALASAAPDASDERAFVADDECAAAGGGCALNALQLKRSAAAAEDSEEDAEEKRCRVHRACRHASGESRQLCKQEERVKCCIRDGGSASHCCANANPQIKARPVCAAASCDTETPCHGASGEARGLCIDEEKVKCCIRDGGSKASCCANANPQIQFRPVCAGGAPACDTETPCHGASGEARGLCIDEEKVKCCINDGGSKSSCCADVNPQIKFRPVCSLGASACDTETPCHGASGESRGLCIDEEKVKCCIRDGGSKSSCCADANPQIQFRPVCAAAAPACDTETPCHGASGEARGLCIDEEKVKCCISDGGSKSSCCADVNPQIKFRPVCSLGASACDTETPCHGASGESRGLCIDEEKVKCCIRDGGSKSSCCASANPQIQFRPVCAGGAPACDTETPCHGASGEARGLCLDEEKVKCCLRDGGSTSSCCADVNPQIKFRPVCSR